jgi:hypothetical protein
MLIPPLQKIPGDGADAFTGQYCRLIGAIFWIVHAIEKPRTQGSITVEAFGETQQEPW